MTVRSAMLRQNPAYRPGGSHLRFLAAVTMIAVGGCGRMVPRQPLPPAAIPTVPPRTTLPTHWVTNRSLLAHEYEITHDAIVITTTDTSVSTDSTGFVVAATVRNTTDGGIAGLIRTFVIGSGGTRGSGLPGLSFPLVFAAPAAATGAQHSLSTRPAAPDPCRSAASVALGVVRDLIFSLPDTLRVGAMWSDSGSYLTCREGAKLTVSTVRTFVVLGFSRQEDRGLLLVRRTQHATLRGSATRGDDTTRVEGSGAGSFDLSIDTGSGALFGAEGTSVLDVRVSGRVRSEHARQELRSSIRGRLP